MGFVSQQILLERYQVFGCFYRIELMDGSIISCRSDLHIVDIEYFRETKGNSNASLLLIMMNPGKSSPIDKDYSIPIYKRVEAAESILNTPIVPTIADDTQKQIMRVMLNLNLKHVRILNISDIKNTDSNNFKLELEKTHFIDEIHSVFCKEREQELQQVLNSLDTDAVILKAWGKTIIDQSSIFKNLVKNNCIPSLPTNKKQLGLQGKSNLHFSHPLPKGNHHSQKQWVQDVSTLLFEIGK